MKEITGTFNSAKVFATTIEESCEQQIQDLCNQNQFKDSVIRIMPDCHSGKSCVIGTTMTIADKIVPNLVGVDISCGVLTANLGKIDLDMKQLDRTIKRNIPMGMNHRDRPYDGVLAKVENFTKDCVFINDTKISRKDIALQLGTLGGG